MQQVLCQTFALTTEQQVQFIRNFASIDNPEQLKHLFEHLLTAPTLAVFEEAMSACLPTTAHNASAPPA